MFKKVKLICLCNKEGKVQFEVYEDDDEMSLSKVLEGYKK